MLRSTRLISRTWILAIAFALFGCSSGGDGTAEIQATAPAALRDASFAGRTENADLFAAVLTHENGVEAYFCDGKRSYWFKGVASDGVIEMQEASGAKLLLELAGDVVVGRLVADGAVTRFDLPQVRGDVLFRADTFAGETRVLGGWIVLPDGAQRGAIKVNTTVINSSLLDGKVVCQNCQVIASGLVPAPFTPTTATRTTNEMQKFTVIGLGDSFMSGEGAPVVNGALTQIIPSAGIEALTQGVGTQETWSDGLPTSRVQNFNLSTAERQLLARHAVACHRGASGLGLAVNALRSSWPSTVDIIHQTFACSGAKVEHLIGTNYSGPGGCSKPDRDPVTCLRYADDMPTASILPQLSDTIAFLERNRLQADALVASIGGNDLGFGDVLADCLVPGTDCSAVDSKAQKAKEKGVKNLPGEYEKLNTAMAGNGVLPGNFLLTSHPNPLLKTANLLCAGSDFLPDLLLVNLSSHNAEFATTVHAEINKQVSNAIAKWNWTGITSHLNTEAGHGLCTGEPWYNHRMAALFTQGRDLASESGFWNFVSDYGGFFTRVDLSAGMFHPNQRGQREAYMPAYQRALESKLNARFKPRTPTLFRPIAFRIENGRRFATLQWADINAFESRNVITSSVGGTTSTTAADATQVTVEVTGGTSATFVLKACFAGPTEICSNNTAGVQVDVRVPVHTPQFTFNGPMIPADGGGPDLSTATEARIGWNDLAASRIYSTVEFDNAGTITRQAVVGQALILPYVSGSQKVRVAACNTLGCGPASAWTDVTKPPAFSLGQVCVPPQRRLLNGCH